MISFECYRCHGFVHDHTRDKHGIALCTGCLDRATRAYYVDVEELRAWKWQQENQVLRLGASI